MDVPGLERERRDSRAFNPLDCPICLELPRRVDALAWQEHIPFAMMLVQTLRPEVFVELGVHTGDSYLAFCQAVSELKCGTACYGVDTWKGDPHAGFYGEDVLARLREYHDPAYGEFSRLVQSTFDEAVGYFADGTVSLLHIDGYHTYEVVKHDWETWKPKMASDGIALFHDINVRERNFGVWKFWDEARSGRPNFAFKHGQGLGVLAAGDEVPDALRWLFELRSDESAAVEALFFALGNRVSLHATTARLTKLLQEREQSYREGLQTRDAKIRALEAALLTSETKIATCLAEKDALNTAHRLHAEQLSTQLSTRIRELEAALADMASSSAVRTARMLREISPGVHRMAGSLARALIPRGRG